MRRFTSSYIIFLAFLTSCSSMHYGTFTPLPEDISKIMVNETMSRLVSHYPPALTRIQFKQGALPGYGQQLSDGLRARGYALDESALHALEKSKPSSLGQVIELHYAIDFIKEANAYRLTIKTNHYLLSSIYPYQGNQALASGLWTGQEFSHG